MALELYHSPYRLTMYYQGLPSLIVPSKMMICGTMTLPYLFRIHLFGVGAKVEDSIISGLVTRQGGFSSSGTFTYPISISRFLTGGVTSRMTSRNYDSDWGDIIRTPTSSYFRFRKNGYSDGSYCWLIGL